MNSNGGCGCSNGATCNCGSNCACSGCGKVEEKPQEQSCYSGGSCSRK